MGKLHVLFRKEEIDEEKISDKVAVVFDVLLATSTITASLHYGAKEVVPVLDDRHAKQEASGRESGSYVLVGEYQGVTIEGFLGPNPLQLKEKVADKTVILSTTNGTVAINRASEAKKVYISSILNGLAVAKKVIQEHQQDTIVVICSGSSGEFCIEDFYGAGYFIDCLHNISEEDWNLTDSAQAALQFYQGAKSKGEEILLASHVGQMLTTYGFSEEVHFVAKQGELPVVPHLKGKTNVVI